MSIPSSTQAAFAAPVPARAGIGLRAAHHDALLAERPDVAFVEVHSENFFGDGGTQLALLDEVRGLYPVSLHGVGLSLGSTDALDGEHLRRLHRLVQRVQPALVSEHLCWTSVNGIHLNDLLPLPYTEEALAHMVTRVTQVQDRLGRRLLIENLSSYLSFADSQMDEWVFLSELATRADCQLLLDVNNVYVSSRNHGFDAATYLANLPRERIAEIHLAGHSVQRHRGCDVLIDTHSTPVCAEVWALYEYALQLFGATPTLIEWDAELPSLARLVAEAHAADSRLEQRHAVAA